MTAELAAPALQVRDLRKLYPVRSATGRATQYVHAVDGVTFDLHEGETLALVGESGSGKTTVGRCIVQLTDFSGGEVLFRGEDVVRLVKQDFRQLRRQVQMVFQDFEGALNPRHTVYRILMEPFDRFGLLDKHERDARVRALIEEVELGPQHLTRFPHQLSGGQQQRVSIARAMASEPSVVVLDEPLSSLDVSVRVQVADLFLSLQQRHGVAYLLISHDLGMVRYLAHRIAVMYLGHIIEICDSTSLFERPLHPYTQALIDSVLEPDPGRATDIPKVVGEIPSVTNPPPGCRFFGRCPKAIPECETGRIPLLEVSAGHHVACIRAEV